MTVATPSLTISEVSRRTGLSEHTLRFYERQGLFLNPVRRSSAGRRRYTEDDVDWLTLCTLLRASGMPLPVIRRYTELVRQGAGTEGERLELLRGQEQRVRAQASQLDRCLDLIRFKIGVYEDHVDAQVVAAAAGQPGAG